MNLIKYEMKEYSYFRLFLCSYKCNTEEKSLNFINISELKEKTRMVSNLILTCIASYMKHFIMYHDTPISDTISLAKAMNPISRV